MPIVNTDIAAVFDEIADLLEVEGANTFRIRAYRNAARMLGELGRSVHTMIERGEDLDALPGIGPDLAAKIVEIARSGTCELLERLRSELPPAVTGLLRIQGLGPKRVRALHQELGVQTLAELHRAAEQGRVRAVHGFGPKTEAQILAATASRLSTGHRHKLPGAMQTAQALLAELDQLHGDLHVHTRDSDGHDSLEAMVTAARSRRLDYLAITDHSQRLAMAHGLHADRLARQIDRIDELNARLTGFTVLKGVEVDILEDGRLDLPDAVLARLDIVVGAVHHRFDLPRERQTDRLLRAMDHPSFTVLAHPSNRLIGERAPCDIDLQRVIRKARERGCFLELNAHPARLDLTDSACRMAKDEGVLVSIASDAHSAMEFDHLRYGIGQARRGWLEARDVLNTRPIGQLRPLLDAAIGRSPAARHKPAAA